MRNRFPGSCACGARVGADEGYFERVPGGWKVRCVKCVVEGKLRKAEEPSESHLSEHQRAWLRRQPKEYRDALFTRP